jgi:hypothetical protein
VIAGVADFEVRLKNPSWILVVAEEYNSHRLLALPEPGPSPQRKKASSNRNYPRPAHIDIIMSIDSHTK